MQGKEMREAIRAKKWDQSAFGQAQQAEQRVEALRQALLEAEVEAGTKCMLAGIPRRQPSSSSGSPPLELVGEGAMVKAPEYHTLHTSGDTTPDCFQPGQPLGPAISCATGPVLPPVSGLVGPSATYLPREYPPDHASLKYLRPEALPPLSPTEELRPSGFGFVDWFTDRKIRDCAELPPLAERNQQVGFAGASYDSRYQPRRAKRLVLGSKLTPAQAAALYYCLGGDHTTWAISQDATPHTHSALAAVRACFDAHVNDVCRGVPTLDVGGNPVRHASHGYTHRHCCTPFIDGADNTRIIKWIGDIRRMNLDVQTSCGAEAAAQQYVTWCSAPAHKCDAKAKVIYSLDSIYYLGESHFVYLMIQADAEEGYVIYHRYSYQTRRYMADATVEILLDSRDQPWVRKFVNGNPTPYVHRYINLGDFNETVTYDTVRRGGEPLVKTVIAHADDVYMVHYTWGRRPRLPRLLPDDGGPVGSKDRRGLAVHPGVQMRDSLDRMAVVPVVVRRDRINWHGMSLRKVENCLVIKLKNRVSSFTGVANLYDAVAEAYRAETQAINATDGQLLMYMEATCWAAVTKLLEAAVNARTFVEPWSLRTLAREALQWCGIHRAYAHAQFGAHPVGSLLREILPRTRMPPAKNHYDLDYYVALAHRLGDVFRLPASQPKGGTRGGTVGRAYLRVLTIMSWVLTLLIFLFAASLMLGLAVAFGSSLRRLFLCLFDLLLYLICASATSGYHFARVFLDISTPTSLRSTSDYFSVQLENLPVSLAMFDPSQWGPAEPSLSSQTPSPSLPPLPEGIWMSTDLNPLDYPWGISAVSMTTMTTSTTTPGPSHAEYYSGLPSSSAESSNSSQDVGTAALQRAGDGLRKAGGYVSRALIRIPAHVSTVKAVAKQYLATWTSKLGSAAASLTLTAASVSLELLDSAQIWLDSTRTTLRSWLSSNTKNSQPNMTPELSSPPVTNTSSHSDL